MEWCGWDKSDEVIFVTEDDVWRDRWSDVQKMICSLYCVITICANIDHHLGGFPSIEGCI